MARKSFITEESMIGKYINRYLYSDVQPVGKIVGIKSKTILLIQPVYASKNKTKMEFEVGGFSAVCTNQSEQQYDFIEKGEVFELRMSVNSGGLRIDEKPRYYYDYNF